MSEDLNNVIFHNDIHRLKWFINFFCIYEKIKDHSLCGILAHKKNKGNALLLRFFKNFDLFNDRSVDEAFDANGCVWRKKFNADFIIFDSNGFVWRKRHKNDSSFNVINYFTDERSEMIDNVVLLESCNVVPLPFFHHGENIRRDSSSGLFSSPYIGEVSNVDKLRTFLKSSINKWGMKFTKLSDVLKEQKLLSQFFQCYEFQKYLWHPDVLYFPRSLSGKNKLLGYVGIKEFFTSDWVDKFDNNYPTLSMDGYPGIQYESFNDFPSQKNYKCKFSFYVYINNILIT